MTQCILASVIQQQLTMTQQQQQHRPEVCHYVTHAHTHTQVCCYVSRPPSTQQRTGTAPANVAYSECKQGSLDATIQPARVTLTFHLSVRKWGVS